MLTTTRDLVADAVARSAGVAAFNVITLEHAEAVAVGAAAAGRAAILQISQNAIDYHGGHPEPLVAACAAVAHASPAPLSLHFDHLTDELLVAAAPDCGVGSVMIDASTLPWRDNVATTARLCAAAHADGLWVEAELGEVGGKAGAHAPGVRTHPEEAARFVAATGVDALAVAVGSSHAMLDRTARLDHALIVALAAAVDVPLVLHGSSGVPDAELRQAISGGIVKVNVGTLLNQSFTGAVRAVLAEDPRLVDPRRYLGPARTALAETVAAVLSVVG